MALITALHPVAFRPFALILSTAFFSSSADGASVGSHCSEGLYHSIVAGETLCKYCERFTNRRLMTGGRTAEGCDSSQVTDLPLVGQPIGYLTHFRLWPVHQKLGQ